VHTGVNGSLLVLVVFVLFGAFEDGVVLVWLLAVVWPIAGSSDGDGGWSIPFVLFVTPPSLLS